MVKGRAGPKSTSLLTDTPACRRTTVGSIATLVCSGLWAGRGPGTVGAGALILLAPPLAHWRTTPPSLYFRVVPLKKGLKPLILRPKKSEDRPLRCCICWEVRSSSRQMRLALRRLEALKAALPLIYARMSGRRPGDAWETPKFGTPQSTTNATIAACCATDARNL